jgi:hypothetical protein
MPSPIRCR